MSGETGARRRSVEGLPLAGRLVLTALALAGVVLAAGDPFSVLFVGSYAVAGCLLVVRRPRNSIGWWLLAVAVGFVGTTGRSDLDLDALVGGTAGTTDFLLAWLGAWAGGVTMLAFLALTILFPSGALPAGRGRGLAVAALVVSASAVVLMATAPTFTFNPDGGATEYTVPNRLALLRDLVLWRGVTGAGLFVVPLGMLAAGVVAMLLRFRRSSGIERLQMRWLVASLAAIVAALLFGLGSIAVLGEQVDGYVWIPAILAYPALPAAVWVAVSRYRLYDIDRIVSRTIGWALVTGLLAAVFVGVVVGLQAVLEPVTENDTLAVAASTLVAATLFQPLRARVQQVVDRRFNRHRVDAQRTIDAFGQQLRSEVDLGALNARLLAATDTTVQPSGVGLWLRGGTIATGTIGTPAGILDGGRG